MLRAVFRKSAVSIFGTTLVGGTSIAAYANTESGKGFKRQLQFWSNFAPIIASYYIYTSSYSPYVNLEKRLFFNDENGDERYNNKRNGILNDLHRKHATELLQILQSLKGLYIKLGQVLSVTALPIPHVYKQELRVLQSDVPGYEDYDTVIKAIIEKELNQPVEEIFEKVEKIPCGAASIGQAHRAKFKEIIDHNSKKDRSEFDVVIKVQYPHAAWQVPADIECIGQFMNLCVFFGVVDETAAKLSYDEFSRQFLSELDYKTETENLKLVHESSLDKVNAPYHKRNVIIPKVFDRFCSDTVITMEYIPGPKIEEEARRQLERLGMTTNRSIKDIVKDAAEDASKVEHVGEENDLNNQLSLDNTNKKRTINNNTISSKWKTGTLNLIGKIVGVDSIFWIVRTVRQTILLSQASTVRLIQSIPKPFVPLSWNKWADSHKKALVDAATLNLTKGWIDALFDVHGHQIFSLGCFNADCHPGNILVVEDVHGMPTETLGLIDYGQCKRLTHQEQLLIARLILSVANNEHDDVIANNFRDLGVKTRNDSSEFLAKFSKLMFGPFQPEHMDHRWHVDLHNMDKVLYFPKELSMVYRTSLLLRGLSLSLQLNSSVSDHWKPHAQAVIDRVGTP